MRAIRRIDDSVHGTVLVEQYFIPNIPAACDERNEEDLTPGKYCKMTVHFDNNRSSMACYSISSVSQ